MSLSEEKQMLLSQVPDDELPPSTKNQIRLMSTFTAFGVPLGKPSQEENER